MDYQGIKMQAPLSPPASPNLQDTSSNCEFKVSDFSEKGKYKIAKCETTCIDNVS